MLYAIYIGIISPLLPELPPKCVIVLQWQFICEFLVISWLQCIMFNCGVVLSKDNLDCLLVQFCNV